MAGGLFVLNSFMALPDKMSIAFSGTALGDAPACGATLAVASTGMIGGHGGPWDHNSVGFSMEILGSSVRFHGIGRTGLLA